MASLGSFVYSTIGAVVGAISAVCSLIVFGVICRILWEALKFGWGLLDLVKWGLQ